MPASLAASQRGIVERVARALADVPGVAALALAGSHARGVARPDSDIDLGIYYGEAEPFEIARIRALAGEWNDEPDPVVTDFYEWGRWVNGGAWLCIDGQQVDLLYRELGKLERTIDDCLRGEVEIDWPQQPPAGFHSQVYLGELHICRPLLDRAGALAGLKRRVDRYPAALGKALVSKRLQLADFTLAHARKSAGRADVLNTVTCLTRSLICLNHVIFALNEAWFLNDKTALAEISGFRTGPPGYAERVGGLLARPGSTAAELEATVAGAECLFREVAGLDPASYAPAFVK